MLYFVLGLFLLFTGYMFYGRAAEKSISPHPGRPTPAITHADGVDFVKLPTWRVFLVQLLNIAGLGPIFGPIMGALWGPQVFLWVIFGSILGGAVHDFLAGVMSVRNDGAGLSALIGHYLGEPARHLATLFILMLMLLVGTVFVKAPAKLLVSMLPASLVGGWLGLDQVTATGDGWQLAWLWIVMGVVYLYYLLATLLPVDKIIGRIYPVFAVALLIMVVGIAGFILFGDLKPPVFTLQNLHPEGVMAWPVIFITVSCGAVSGFHSTQSPIMARCISNERYMRPVFYGAMIAEGFIALIWASAAMGWYGSPAALQEALGAGGPAAVVHTICTGTMGTVGGILAILGVVVLPITSGDTAFRVARLIAAEYLRLDQRPARNRYLIAVPLFGMSLGLQFVDFNVIWQYFGWANQTLAAVALWTGAVFLGRRGRWWWMAAIPAMFMTVTTVTYLMVAPVGLALSQSTGTLVGLVVGGLAAAAFLFALPRLQPESDDTPPHLAGPTQAEQELGKLGD